MKYLICSISLCFITIFVFGCVPSEEYTSYYVHQGYSGDKIFYQKGDPCPVYIILEPGGGTSPQTILEMFGFITGGHYSPSETRPIVAEMADKLGTTIGGLDFLPPSTDEIGWRYNPYPYPIKIERGLVYTLDGRYIGKYKELPKFQQRPSHDK